MIYVGPCADMGAEVHEAEAGEQQPLAAGASCEPLVYGCIFCLGFGSADRRKRIYIAPCADMGAEVHEAETGEQQPLAAGTNHLFTVAPWVWIPAWQRD